MDEKLNSKEVLNMVGISQKELHRLCTTGRFPKPKRTEFGTPYWYRTDVIEWVEERKDSEND